MIINFKVQNLKTKKLPCITAQIIGYLIGNMRVFFFCNISIISNVDAFFLYDFVTCHYSIIIALTSPLHIRVVHFHVCLSTWLYLDELWIPSKPKGTSSSFYAVCLKRCWYKTNTQYIFIEWVQKQGIFYTIIFPWGIYFLKAWETFGDLWKDHLDTKS